MFMAFTYDENTHEKVYVCYGVTKKEASGMFFTRTKGLGLTCLMYEVDKELNPIGNLEMRCDWVYNGEDSENEEE